MSIIAIDFEASCLPRHGRSYPIEVGVSSIHGTRNWIIAPHPLWDGWDWTAQAEALHGISQAKVAREGLPAAQVWSELVAAIGPMRPVADSRIDQYWMDLLAQAAGAQTSLTIDHVATLMDEWRVDESMIAQAVATADCAYPFRHRAAADARWLAAVIGGLRPAPSGMAMQRELAE